MKPAGKFSMTLPKLELHPEAIAEARGARLWYAERDQAIAQAFAAELDRAIAAVVDQPLRWPNYLGGRHRFLMRRFPYGVVYRPSSEIIHVVAVAHARRKPGYWIGR